MGKVEATVAISLRWGTVSITGNFRENNEDRCLADSQGRYFLVADGMGGQSAGEKASEMAVELIPKKLDALINFQGDKPEKVKQNLDTAIGHANAEIMALSELDPEFHNMGTTIAVVVRTGDHLHVAGIGDSRVYLLRGTHLERLTQDHSLSQALLEAGTITAEDAARHRYRNVLYRYLGTKEGGTGANAKLVEPQPGDRLMICSDGASEGVPDDKIAKLLGQNKEPQAIAQEIVEAAQAGGSKDNITCLVILVE